MNNFFLVAVLALAAARHASAACDQIQFMHGCLTDPQGCCWEMDADTLATQCFQCNGIKDSEQTALSDFYEHFNVEHSPQWLDSWAVDAIKCNGGATSAEHPIGCDVHGQITQIQLVNDGLWGTADGLCFLSALPMIDSILLSDNYIHSSLPTCLNSFASSAHLERLMLSHNFLRGPIPTMTSLTRLETGADGDTQCHLSTNGMALAHHTGGDVDSPETNCFECPWPGSDVLPPACDTIGNWNHCGIHGTESVTACPDPVLPPEPTGTTTTTQPSCLPVTVSSNACLFSGGSMDVSQDKQALCQATNNAPTMATIPNSPGVCQMALIMKPECARHLKAYECTSSCPACGDEALLPCESVCNTLNTQCPEIVTACALTLNCAAAGEQNCLAGVDAQAPPDPVGAGGLCNAGTVCAAGLTCTNGMCAMMDPGNVQGGPNFASSLAVSSTVVVVAAGAAAVL